MGGGRLIWAAIAVRTCMKDACEGNFACPTPPDLQNLGPTRIHFKPLALDKGMRKHECISLSVFPSPRLF
eukprot:3244329-Amphidinium_carterae.2